MQRLAFLVFFLLVSVLVVLVWSSSPGPVSSCILIDSPGTYTLNQDITGAPFDHSLGGKTCVLITASDVTFDCNGFTIDGGGLPGSGIFLDGPVSNVIVRNCQVNGYRKNVYIYRSSGNIIANNSVISLEDAFTLDSSSSNTFDGNTVRNSIRGFYSTFSSDNNFTNNDVYLTGVAFDLQNSFRNYYYKNNIFDTQGYGFSFLDSSDNVLVSNRINFSYGWGAQLINANNNVFENNTFSNSVFINVYLTTSNNNRFLRNNLSNANISVLFVSGSSNVFTNNTVTNNGEAFALYSAIQNTFSGNKVSNNILAFGISPNSNGNSFDSNTVYNNGNSFDVWSSGNTFSGNTVFNSEFPAFWIRNCSSNIIRDNIVYQSGNDGIAFEESSNNLVSGNTVYNTKNGIGFNFGSSSNTISDNTVFNNSRFGIHFEGSSNNNAISQNIAYQNEFSGISISNSSLNTMANNILFSNSQTGTFFENAENNTFSGNTVYDNFLAGIVLAASNRNSISDNVVYGSNPANITVFGEIPGGILLIERSTNNTIQRNSVYANNQYGIGFFASSSGNIIGSNIFANNSVWGILVDKSSNNIFTSNEVYGNKSGIGIYINDSTGTTMDRDHFFKNGYDFAINSSLQSMDIKLMKVVFDNPAGTYENETMLSLNDTLRKGDSYSIRWATNSTKPPEGRFSVKRKYVNMSTSVDLLIDSITWHWNDADTEGAIEDSFELWTYNGSWNVMKDFTVNTTTNSLNVTNVNASFYGILYANATAGDCQYVTVALNFTPGCDQNTVALTAGGSPLSLANVTVLREGNIMATGSTDSTGKFFFNGTGASVEIFVNKPRTATTCYSVPGAGRFSVNLKSPADCGIPGCDDNEDCPAGQVCTSGTCTILPECTKDTDCPSGKVCMNSKCAEPQQPTQGCASDSDCAAEQYCSAGNCTPVVEGTCGQIVNHAWVPYECCTDADCASGLTCQGNICTGVNYDLAGPASGFQNDNISLTAFLNSQPLSNGQVKIVAPDGSFGLLTTDASGTVTFQLSQTGTYSTYLLINNSIAKTSTLISQPKQESFVGSASMDALAQAGLLLVFLITGMAVLVFLLYYFIIGRKPEKRLKKKKKKKVKKAPEKEEMLNETEGE